MKKLVWHASLLCATLLALSCVTSGRSGFDEGDFADVVAAYRAAPGPKALALGTEANGRWAYAFVESRPSTEGAVEEALASCQKSARSGGLRATCRLFARDDEAASETVDACLARKMAARRCQMQRQFQSGLLVP